LIKYRNGKVVKVNKEKEDETIDERSSNVSKRALTGMIRRHMLRLVYGQLLEAT
jgi:hypothetical protein